MTRLIDADDIVLDYSGLANISPLDFRGTAEYFAKQIDAMPTIEAVPVKHGKWLCKRYGVAFDGKRFPFRTIAVCSECNETSCDAGDYCPWCGARMDEK